jgi:hypothetical protein
MKIEILLTGDRESVRSPQTGPGSLRRMAAGGPVSSGWGRRVTLLYRPTMPTRFIITSDLHQSIGKLFFALLTNVA